jgi:hypothetical protein
MTVHKGKVIFALTLKGYSGNRVIALWCWRELGGQQLCASSTLPLVTELWFPLNRRLTGPTANLFSALDEANPLRPM